MVSYVLLVIAGQTLFLLLYDVLLKKSTFFNSNRVYLLLTFAVSLVLPLLRFQVFENTVPTALQITNYTEVASRVVMLDGVTVTAKNQMSIWTQFSIWEWIFMIGCLLSLLLFSCKLYTLTRLKFKGKHIEHNNFTEVIVPQSNIAFSFFNTMFLGEAVKQKPHAHIVAHELVHMQQKHSWDLLYFEVFRIVFWFNPLVYIYQKRIAELHEFIADSNTSKNHKKEQYQQLLQEVFQTEHISFVNQFFNQSLIKKRIVMLQKSKSKKSELVNYTLLVPAIVALLWYSSSLGQTSTVAVENTIGNQIQEKPEGAVVVGFSTDREAVKPVPAKMEEVVMEYPEQLPVNSDSILPFNLATVKPAFKGYENSENPIKTFDERMGDHVRRVFRYPEEAQKRGEQGRIDVKFVISKEGKVQVLETRGKSVLLSQEGKRIIEKLPELIPAKDANGNVIPVQYVYPIVFRLN